MSYSIKVENAKAAIEIINLRLCDGDFCHVTFDVCFCCYNYTFKTNFSEMYIDRLDVGGDIVDENRQEKRLRIGKDELSLEILSKPDELSDFQMKCSLKLEREKIRDFLIEFKSYLSVLAEEGMANFEKEYKNNIKKN